MSGQRVCHAHGGRAKQNKRAATLRVVDQEARELFGKVAPEVTGVDNPLAAYSEVAGRVMAWMRLMDRLLDELTSVGYEAESGEQVRAAVQLYERAMDRANTVLGSYARLRIDERLAAITEAQANKVISAIDAALEAAGITGPAALDAKKAAARHLRAV